MENKKNSESFEFDKAIDPESIANLYDNDYNWIEEVFSSVLAEYDSGTDKIEQTLAEKDVEGLRKAVHKMKPVFGFVGMLQVQEMCKNLEDKCQGETSIAVLENDTTILLNNLTTCREILEKEYDRIKIFNQNKA
jgi:HPt (histidine-containing phosphotransfer) domain-containing protein